MSVVGECAIVEQALQRVRSLVCPYPFPPEAAALGGVDIAARSTEATARMTNGASGAAISAHSRFAIDNAAALTAAGQLDRTLHSHLSTAAASAHAGARRLDAIADRTRATAGFAARAVSPTAQRAVLAALRVHLVQAADVMDSVRRQGADLAEHVRSLDYGPPAAPAARESHFPDGPVVWCVRPNGTFGKYRCSVLYPDLKVSTYWSPTDDTHG